MQNQASMIIYPNKLYYIAKSFFQTVQNDVKSCKNATTICTTASRWYTLQVKRLMMSLFVFFSTTKNHCFVVQKMPWFGFAFSIC